MLKQFKIIDNGERDQLRAELIKRSKRDQSYPSHSQGGWRSADDLLTWPVESAQWLRAQIYRLLVVGEVKAWGVVNGYGASHSRHRHRQGYSWSGVYYLDDSPTATVFELENGLREIRPEPGLLIIFPIDLWHFVERHSHHEPRVTVAFDAR